MKYEYPYFVSNIAQLMKWFDKEKKEATGKGLSPSKFPMCGGSIKNILKSNGISLDDYKTVLWGVMNLQDNVYSPVYAKYHLKDLPKYKDLKEDYEETKCKKKKEVSFNKVKQVEEEKQGGFFDGL